MKTQMNSDEHGNWKFETGNLKEGCEFTGVGCDAGDWSWKNRIQNSRCKIQK
jgi:hypothetical protein